MFNAQSELDLPAARSNHHSSSHQNQTKPQRDFLIIDMLLLALEAAKALKQALQTTLVSLNRCSIFALFRRLLARLPFLFSLSQSHCQDAQRVIPPMGDR